MGAPTVRSETQHFVNPALMELVGPHEVSKASGFRTVLPDPATRRGVYVCTNPRGHACFTSISPSSMQPSVPRLLLRIDKVQVLQHRL